MRQHFQAWSLTCMSASTVMLGCLACRRGVGNESHSGDGAAASSSRDWGGRHSQQHLPGGCHPKLYFQASRQLNATASVARWSQAAVELFKLCTQVIGFLNSEGAVLQLRLLLSFQA